MRGSAAAQRAALRAAFGSSDSDAAAADEPDDEEDSGTRAVQRAEPHAVIPGLSLLRGFLSPAAQAALLTALSAHGWTPEADGAERNQAMRFGFDDLPPFAQALARQVAAAAALHSMLPPDLASRRPAFNQFICNSYAPGQGIMAHVDLAAFSDGIASVSLGAAAVMDFRHTADGRTVAVRLLPGDLLTLHGPARYDWTHGIAARHEDVFEGVVFRRGQRVSVTMRRMAADVHELSHEA